MNSALRMFFLCIALFTNSKALLCGPKHILQGNKPSLNMPVGQWEAADQAETAKQIEIETAKKHAITSVVKKITFTNIDSPVTSPKAQPEKFQGVISTRQ